MEDQLKSNVANIVNPKKNTPAKKAAPSKNKDAEAKAKVEELLKNTSVAGLVKSEPVKPEFDVQEIKLEKNAKWMEEQINLLNNQIEQQENELMYYRNEVEKLNAILQTGGAGQAGVGLASNDLSPNLVALFRHFESVYTNGYTDAKIAHAESGQGVLDMMLQFFPELQNVRRYKYRGQGR